MWVNVYGRQYFQKQEKTIPVEQRGVCHGRQPVHHHYLHINAVEHSATLSGRDTGRLIGEMELLCYTEWERHRSLDWVNGVTLLH